MSSSDDSQGTDSSNVFEGGGKPYDPDAPVPHWHQNMELATICVANSLSLLIIIARVWIRRVSLKRFRMDDMWIAAAGIVLIFPHWSCQIATNWYGSGLHSENIPDKYLIPYWQWSWGWAGYYLVTSLIKISVCYCILEILPHSFKSFRMMVYLLTFVIGGTGLAMTLVWLFQCKPFLSNFIYAVEPLWCVNIEIMRYMWVTISVLCDLCLVCIPFLIINRVRLRTYERKALYVVFGAALLGTITCLIGIYGIWMNRNGQAFSDASYTATIFVMCNDIEIFTYTLGASATVLSKFFISKAAAMSSTDTANHHHVPSISFSEWSSNRLSRWRMRHSASHPYQNTTEEDSKPVSMDEWSGHDNSRQHPWERQGAESSVGSAKSTPNVSPIFAFGKDLERL